MKQRGYLYLLAFVGGGGVEEAWVCWLASGHFAPILVLVVVAVNV